MKKLLRFVICSICFIIMLRAYAQEQCDEPGSRQAQKIRIPRLHSLPALFVSSLDVSPDNRMLAVGFSTQEGDTALLFDVENLKNTRLIKALNDHSGGVEAVALSQKYLFTGGLDGRVNIYDTANPENITMIRSISDHDQSVTVVTVSFDDALLATAGLGPYIYVYELDAYDITLFLRIGPFGKPVKSINFAKDTRFLAIGFIDGEVTVFELSKAASFTSIFDKYLIFQLNSLNDHSNPVYVSFDNKGNLLTASQSKIILYKAHTENYPGCQNELNESELANTLKELSAPTETGCLIDYHQLAASVVADQEHRNELFCKPPLWALNNKLSTFRVIKTLTSSQSIQALAVRPNSDSFIFATGGSEPAINFYRLNLSNAIEQTKSFEISSKFGVDALIFDSRGLLFSGGALDVNLQIWGCVEPEPTTTSEPLVIQTLTSTSEPVVIQTLTTTSEPVVIQTLTTTSEPVVIQTLTTTSEPVVIQTLTTASESVLIQTQTTTSAPSLH